jgi:hypothetical protein
VVAPCAVMGIKANRIAGLRCNAIVPFLRGFTSICRVRTFVMLWVRVFRLRVDYACREGGKAEDRFFFA